MRCYHCSQEIENGLEVCPYCGANQGAGATVVLDQVYNPYAAEPESGRTDTLPQQGYGDVQNEMPRIQFPTKRGLIKMILLGVITLGIYDIVIWSKLVTELNIAASRYDGKRTMPYLAMVMLSPITFGILTFVWFHKLCNRIGKELIRRGYNYKFSAATFWLWNILGSLIIVGPFVFIHKLMAAMNLINSDFNMKD